MKAAIAGAGEEALHTIRKAHEYGLKVLALDGNPEAAGLREADEALVVDISNEEAVLRALGGAGVDFLLTAPIGRYLTTTGAANDALGLPGISREMAEVCTDKFRFHQRLWENGLRQCRCYGVEGNRITDADGRESELSGAGGLSAREWELSFPAILKPRYGSGSRGIHMISGPGDLEGALRQVFGGPYVLEECVAGPEYGVDAAVTREGFWMILLRLKENTPPPARQAVGYFSVPPSDPFYGQVRDYMREAAVCLGLEECLIHADIIRGEKGPFAIELSARPSGHNLHNLFTPLCTGVDMAEQYIRYRMGLSHSFRPRQTRSMMIHYFDMEGRVRRAPEREQVQRNLKARLAAWECRIRAGQVLGPVSDGHSLMGRGYFVLEGGDAAFLREQGEIVKGLFGGRTGL